MDCSIKKGTRFNCKGKVTRKKCYLKRLVVNAKWGKPHLVKGDVFLLSHAGDEFHPFFRRPIDSLDAIDISRSASALKEGSLPRTHGLDAPFGPARKEIKASETMTN